MASPIDKNIVARQNQQVRGPGAEPRPRANPAGTPPATAAPAHGRRSQPAVSVSLSAEALQLLNGNREPVRQARPQPPEPRKAPVEETEAVAGGAVFELLDDDTFPQQREAPFAHVAKPEPGRYQLPGGRLDITV